METQYVPTKHTMKNVNILYAQITFATISAYIKKLQLYIEDIFIFFERAYRRYIDIHKIAVKTEEEPVLFTRPL